MEEYEGLISFIMGALLVGCGVSWFVLDVKALLKDDRRSPK